MAIPSRSLRPIQDRLSAGLTRDEASLEMRANPLVKSSSAPLKNLDHLFDAESRAGRRPLIASTTNSFDLLSAPRTRSHIQPPPLPVTLNGKDRRCEALLAEPLGLLAAQQVVEASLKAAVSFHSFGAPVNLDV